MMEETLIRLTFDHGLKVGAANLLRGAIASAYLELGLLHNHDGDGYRYGVPLVQYKVVNEKGVIIGLQAGSEVLKKIAFDREDYRLGEKTLHVLEREVRVREVQFGISAAMMEYRFFTPWMALNRDNYHKYVRVCPDKQKVLLKKILVGNLISLSKGVGYTVSEKIEVGSLKLTEVPIKLKGTPMLGFSGRFVVNFTVPELWGIGKSASRGFGTVEMLQH